MDKLRLTIELVPKGAWGNTLSKILPKKDWDALRQECYEKGLNMCSVCGKNDVPLDAHEVWKFDIKDKTQTLMDIIPLCSACHGVKHMRNSERIGYGKEAKAHFMKINRCSSTDFEFHYDIAKDKFEELNKILRWTLVADLAKFGVEGIEIKQRQIPIIENPYEEVDWTTVRQVSSLDLPSNYYVNINYEIILQPYDKKSHRYITIDEKTHKKYFLKRNSNPNKLTPRICCIDIDNYSGTIKIVADRANRIEWLLNGKKILTKFNFCGKIISEFCVKNLEDSNLCFRLVGDGGEAFSLPFKLLNIDFISQEVV